MSKMVVLRAAVSPAARCYFVRAKFEGVHELFQVYRICGKKGFGIIWLNTAYYTTKSL